MDVLFCTGLGTVDDGIRGLGSGTGKLPTSLSTPTHSPLTHPTPHPNVAHRNRGKLGTGNPRAHRRGPERERGVFLKRTGRARAVCRRSLALAATEEAGDGLSSREPFSQEEAPAFATVAVRQAEVTTGGRFRGYVTCPYGCLRLSPLCGFRRGRGRYSWRSLVSGLLRQTIKQ